MRILASLIIGYLYGSIPLGYILGKMKGVDVTQEGYRKIGTSNVYRVLGIQYAVLTFIFDLTKGVLVVLISKKILALPVEIAFVSGIAAICGHNFPIWLKFKGQGRGVATSLGLLFYLLPSVTVGVFVVYVIITLITRSSAPGTPVLFVLLPAVTWATKKPPWALYFTLSLLAVFLFTRIAGGLRYIQNSPDRLRALVDVIVWDRSD